MSRLDELIKELCPNGVEHKTIREIATDIYRGTGIKKDQITDEGIPCVRYGEIYTTYGIWFDRCVSHTNEKEINNRKYFEHGDILFAITGEKVEEIAKSCAYVGNEKCLAGGDIVVLKHKQNPKYLSYALSTYEAQVQKSRGKVKSKVVHSSVPDIKEIKIPIPPLEVQQEIVRILDNFTELTEELTAELTARKKQYEYYRDHLLSFDVDKVDYKAIQFLTQVVTPKGKLKSTDYKSFGEFPVIDQGQNFIGGYTDEDIAFPAQPFVVFGDHTCIVKYVNFPFVQGADGVKVLSANECIDAKYLYYCMKSIKLHGGYSRHWSQMKKIEIPVPSMNVQKRLVEVLDNFDSICNDLQIGLPAEIEARQKQYEYYRDKLLSFK